jgi:hypothetical protein
VVFEVPTDRFSAWRKIRSVGQFRIRFEIFSLSSIEGL